MIKRLKLIVTRAVLTAAIALSAGCTTDEAVAVAPGNDQTGVRAIGFDYYTAQAVTRADGAKEVVRAIPSGGTIGVYAYYHQDSRWSAAAKPNFMFNQWATNLGDDEGFSYDPLKYWPNSDADKLSFMAYYPYTDYPSAAPYGDGDPDTPTGIKPQLAIDDSGLPTFLFTVNSTPAQQVDFLVSDLLPNLPNGTTAVNQSASDNREGLTIVDRVRFYFRHALTKVLVRIIVDPAIEHDVANLKLNSLSITNLANKGKLTPDYTPEDGTTFGWSEQAGNENYDVDPAHAYLLMPQTLADASVLNIDYELTMKSENTVYNYDEKGKAVVTGTYTYRHSTAVRLNTLCPVGSSTPLTTWEPNHQYFYTIRIGANRIDFTAEVVEWGDTDSINVNFDVN